MALATWWDTDALPRLDRLPSFHVRRAGDDDNLMLARLNRITLPEVTARRRDGHQPYIGYIATVPVAYGWLATRQASIGELNLTIKLPQGHRYLWDFATRPEWQGCGIYPRLLQCIVRQEAQAAARFWIIYAPENLPSSSGVRKAGFTPVAEISFDAERKIGLAPIGAMERAQVAAKVFGVPLVSTLLAPCWSCQHGDEVNCVCWPAEDSAVDCSCAVPLRTS